MEQSDVAPARMTQLHLAILMHCNAINEPYGVHHVVHGVSPATLEYTEQLLNRGLIERDVAWESRNTVSHPALRKYVTTDKGRRFCDRILDYASGGAPLRSKVSAVKEPRLRDSCTFYEFFSTLKLPGWVWMLLGAVLMWR